MSSYYWDGDEWIKWDRSVTLSGSTASVGTIDAKGIYNVTEPTLSDGDKAQLQLRSNGDLKSYVTNDSIEQVTGTAHNTYNIAVAGKSLTGKIQPFATDISGNVSVFSAISIPESDEIALGYTGSNLTSVTFKRATVTMATLTLAYSGDTLTGVTKS